MTCPVFGRAGLSVIVPILSAMGVQAVAVPTAVLSTHTGGLGAPARLTSPGYGPAALAHYRRLGLKFDCIYSGYLSETSQALLVEQAIEYWPDALAVVDPVMGDNGRMYSGLPAEMVPALYTLCSHADIILPNATEAALLLGDAPAGRKRRHPRLCSRGRRPPDPPVTAGTPDRHSRRPQHGVQRRRARWRRLHRTHPAAAAPVPWHGGYLWRRICGQAAAGQRGSGPPPRPPPCLSATACALRRTAPTSGTASGWKTYCPS